MTSPAALVAHTRRIGEIDAGERPAE